MRNIAKKLIKFTDGSQSKANVTRTYKTARAPVNKNIGFTEGCMCRGTMTNKSQLFHFPFFIQAKLICAMQPHIMCHHCVCGCVCELNITKGAREDSQKHTQEKIYNEIGCSHLKWNLFTWHHFWVPCKQQIYMKSTSDLPLSWENRS